MGLPMFVEPDGGESRIAAKGDPTASRRSTIRRQRTVRYSPGTRLHRQPSPQNPARRQRGDVNTGARSTDPRRSLLQDIRQREEGASNHTAIGQIARFEASLARGDPLHDRNEELVHDQATFRNRMESENANLPLTNNRARTAELSGPRDDSLDQHNFEAFIERSAGFRSPAPRYMPTPPYTSRGSPIQSPVHRYNDRPARAAYTPGFPPAHRLEHFDVELRRSERLVDLTALAARIRDLQAVERYRHDSELDSMLSSVNSMITRGGSQLSQEYLQTESDVVGAIKERVEVLISRAILNRDLNTIIPARRQSRRERRIPHSHFDALQRDDLDGLGDRERSFSPEGVSWEPMLTNITPDDRMPSAHSSFDSATTSASSFGSLSSSSSSSSSYGTQFTAPSSSVSVEPCPAMEPSTSQGGFSEEPMVEPSSLRQVYGLADSPLPSRRHLDRIESLSARLSRQQARDEHTARHRRTREREAELQRLEATLHRLERQIEEENLSVPGAPRLGGGVRAGRERL